MTPGRRHGRLDRTCELTAIAAEFGSVELDLLVLLATRLRAGQARYGRLVLARDRRDFAAEALEELADACVYLTAALLRRRQGRTRRRRAGRVVRG